MPEARKEGAAALTPVSKTCDFMFACCVAPPPSGRGPDYIELYLLEQT